MSKYLIGDDKLLKNLKQIRLAVGKREGLKAERKAAKPIVTRARKILLEAPNKTSGNLDGFEHLRALSKATKVVTYKGGINVQISPRTPDLPMASRREYWNAYGVGRLYAFGRRVNKGTGTTKGFTDWVDRAGEIEGPNATNILATELKKELDIIIANKLNA